MQNPLYTDQQICCICRESLSTEPTTQLDCSHVFHTRCVISWFRSPRDNYTEVGGCPLCRDRPRISPFSFSRRYHTVNGRVAILRSLVRNKKNIVPDPIRKAVMRVKKAELAHTKSRQELREYTQSKTVKEGLKKWRKLKTQRWKKWRVVQRRRCELAAFDPMSCINFFT